MKPIQDSTCCLCLGRTAHRPTPHATWPATTRCAPLMRGHSHTAHSGIMSNANKQELLCVGAVGCAGGGSSAVELERLSRLRSHPRRGWHRRPQHGACMWSRRRSLIASCRQLQRGRPLARRSNPRCEAFSAVPFRRQTNKSIIKRKKTREKRGKLFLLVAARVNSSMAAVSEMELVEKTEALNLAGTTTHVEQQWVAQVTAFSSQYGATAGGYGAASIVGPPQLYPATGSNGKAWCPATTSAKALI